LSLMQQRWKRCSPKVVSRRNTVVGVADCWINQHRQLLFHILRWSAVTPQRQQVWCGRTSLALAGGLGWSSHFKSHTSRPLKNDFRIRTISVSVNQTIHKSGSYISRPLRKTQASYCWAYNPKREGWGEWMHLSNIIRVSPKATRDRATTCLKEKNINESVICRILWVFTRSHRHAWID
jgi:hypothetical protein